MKVSKKKDSDIFDFRFKVYGKGDIRHSKFIILIGMRSTDGGRTREMRGCAVSING